MSQSFTITDTFFALIVGIIALAARLWTIAHPQCVVFDEVHFGNFSKWYVLNQFHFDIHPPLGKMLMGYIAKATQYQGEIETFPNLGKDYKINETSFISQRQTPAIFSAMVAPLLYCSMRNLAISPYPSFAAGLMIALDSSMIVEAKFILSDGMLHFFSALHIFAFSLFLRTQNNWHVLFGGITLGLAASCKFTALGLLAVDGISQVVWIFVKWPDLLEITIRALLLLVPALLVFFLVFVIHFAMTPYAGYHAYYIKQSDYHTLIEPEKINSTYFGNRALNSPLFVRIIQWIVVMNRINMRSNCPHPWSSSPQYWPFLMDKWVSFYTSGSKRIPCFGLPASYWPSTLSIILVPLLILFKCANWKNLLWCLGWGVSYFPFLRIPRTMFHYHYLVPLMFAVMNLFTLIDVSFKNNPKGRGYVVTLLAILDILCFLYFSPIIYGTPCPDCPYSRTWLKRWTEGPPKYIPTYGLAGYNTTKMYGVLPA